MYIIVWITSSDVILHNIRGRCTYQRWSGSVRTAKGRPTVKTSYLWLSWTYKDDFNSAGKVLMEGCPLSGFPLYIHIALNCTFSPWGHGTCLHNIIMPNVNANDMQRLLPNYTLVYSRSAPQVRALRAALLCTRYSLLHDKPWRSVERTAAALITTSSQPAAHRLNCIAREAIASVDHMTRMIYRIEPTASFKLLSSCIRPVYIINILTFSLHTILEIPLG